MLGFEGPTSDRFRETVNVNTKIKFVSMFRKSKDSLKCAMFLTPIHILN